MAIIRLHRVTYSGKTVNGFNVRNGFEPILFNTDTIIKIEVDRNEGSHITHKEAMVSGFNCKETLEEIEALIEKSNN